MAPWEEQLQTDIGETSESQTEAGGSMQIAVSSSARNEVVGFGGVIQKQPPKYKKPRLKTFSVTLGARSEQSPSILGRAGSNGTRIEDVTSTETVQNHASNEQQRGRTHTGEPAATVRPGTRLPNIQVD
jgi:hypothetical protein